MCESENVIIPLFSPVMPLKKLIGMPLLSALVILEAAKLS